MSSGLQGFCCFMSTLIQGRVVLFLDELNSVSGTGNVELPMNVLYVLQKLTGGTRTSVWLGGSLRLEENLHLLGVLGRSDLSVVGGHFDCSSEVCLHRIRFYAGKR